ncbi:Flp pilus assembly protein CpaB [Roseibium salinum]|uniref:Flp pilus assembly protein CpaB n=1 Tax=Roseibium salinum TaxID=1604349 RepID=A0ABT3R0C0_9HYPH|nr:Flp pilus assembly protein CpaB [Roseibium sp. DSM 29163]MCX2722543.1 Flp pilus assembly protein CpaB [Roseibium sp. DSM 29163]
MNFVRLLVLAVALGAGVVAFRMVSESGSPVPPPPEVKISGAQVLVATRDILLGNKLAGPDLAWVEWPENAVPEGALTKESSPAANQMFLGRIAKAPIFSGEPIRPERLISTDKGYMAAILPKGKRAIAVKVEQETSAGGFILPGDKVDLILTRKISDGVASSETIMRNIRVLAIDSITAGEQETKNLAPQRTATLELTIGQSEIVAQSQQVGTIALALRSAEDSADDTLVEEEVQRDPKFVRIRPDRWSVGTVQGDVQ